ncbi:hypothetical protein BST81_17125 [Leptolyngbya sp. 'hensonii']|uniref:CHAT domain-containing protein n=1 Tax=Leptolyngbya sp. 'hensonii' TaxID=1922337 RepID=UPI000950032E|nr:CHAT domain-containing protein [Leptolyngbya sp. 'hensonii']OLP17081.1 hypothetical protein BST81_17125 [Leptolyngbya sp. 'hensonii']
MGDPEAVVQEFYLSITPVGSDEYLVRTERVAPGVPLAEEQVRWPVETWLNQARQLMNDPLMNILQGGQSAGERSSNLVDLGQQFYNVLFQGTIRDSWTTARGIAHHCRETLRLRLGLKGDRLPRLPWEVLHAENRSIATGTDIVFSRYQPTVTSMVLPLQMQSKTLLRGGQPWSQIPQLNILVVIAAPTDQENLELKQEVLHLQQELQQVNLSNGRPAAKTPQIQLTLLEQPDRQQLTQALEQGHYHVLHYAGHSNLAAAGGNLYLVNRRTGLSETLSGDDLAGLLVNNGIRMVVFNSCRGAYTAAVSLTEELCERSLAEALVRRGIPAVLAMAERIPDEVALTLTRLFYRNLRQGYPVDLSLSRARQGLVSAYGSQQLYWALPILYMHPDFDGYLAPHGDQDAPLVETPPVVSPLNGTSSSIVAPNPTTPPPLATPTNRTPAQLWEHPADDRPGQAQPLEVSFPPPKDLPRQAQPASETTVTQPIRVMPQSGNPPLNGDRDYLDLVANLNYQDDPELEAERPSVGELIQRLSQSELEVEDNEESPIVQASNLESLLPGGLELQTSNFLALEIPENPLYRQQATSPVYAPADLELGTFNSFQWQVRDFLKVPFVPIVVWRSVVTQQMQLPTTLTHQAQSSSNGLLPGDTVGASGASVYSRPRLESRLSSVPAAYPTGNGQARLWAILWPLLAGMGITIALLAGVKLLPQAMQLWSKPSSPSPQQSKKPSPNPSRPATNNATLAEQGKAALQQGQTALGQRIVEQLLDRNALDEAEAVLAQARPAQADQAAIQFLRGRLVVQSVRADRKQYSLHQAKPFFEAAVKKDPNSLAYLNALGFVCYALGDLNRAQQVWFSASYLIEEQKDAVKPKTFRREDILMANSGLALVFLKSGQTSESLSMRDSVLKEQPTGFRPEVLQKNWMWSPQAVEDWRKLLKI